MEIWIFQKDMEKNFLRDREEFYKTVLEFSLLGDAKSLKPLLVLSFKKLFENKEYEENVFFF